MPTTCWTLGHRGTFQAGPQGASPTDCLTLAGYRGWVKRNATFKVAVKSIVCEEVIFIIF